MKDAIGENFLNSWTDPFSKESFERDCSKLVIELFKGVPLPMALLKILALGTRQIEEGKVQPAEDVIKRLRKRREAH